MPDQTYEIEDPKTGKTYEVKSPRPLTQADIERVVAEGRRQARSVAAPVGKTVATASSMPARKGGQLDEFDQTFGRGYRPADPTLKRW